MVTQAIALSRKPHVVIGTPGRIVDHLENTKVLPSFASLPSLYLVNHTDALQGFSLKSLKFLVMDEADRMLSMDFEESLDKILQVSRLGVLATCVCVSVCLSVTHTHVAVFPAYLRVYEYMFVFVTVCRDHHPSSR